MGVAKKISMKFSLYFKSSTHNHTHTHTHTHTRVSIRAKNAGNQKTEARRRELDRPSWSRVLYCRSVWRALKARPVGSDYGWSPRCPALELQWTARLARPRTDRRIAAAEMHYTSARSLSTGVASAAAFPPNWASFLAFRGFAHDSAHTHMILAVTLTNTYCSVQSALTVSEF